MDFFWGKKRYLTFGEYSLTKIIWTKKVNVKTISDRGWNSLNYWLLTDPKIVATKTVYPPPDTDIEAREPLIGTATTTATATATATSPTTVSVIDESVIGTTTNTIPIPTLTVYIHLAEPTITIIPLDEPVDQTVITALIFKSTADTTIVIEVNPFPWINITNLNFDNRLASEFTVDILQHMVRKEKISKNLNTRYKRGREKRK